LLLLSLSLILILIIVSRDYILARVVGPFHTFLHSVRAFLDPVFYAVRDSTQLRHYGMQLCVGR
jgi:hypothetical protein